MKTLYSSRILHLTPSRELDFQYLLSPPPPPQPSNGTCFESEKNQIIVFSLKGHLYSFPQVHQGSLSSSKARSFESLSLLFLPAGWQVSGGIFRPGLSALFSTGPCGSSSSLMEKHGMVLSKNHAYALFCLCFFRFFLSFIS